MQPVSPAQSPHPGFNMLIDGKTSKVFPGDKLWTSRYAHSPNATRCASLTEPTEVSVGADNYLYTQKGKKFTKYGRLFRDEKSCRESFDNSLKRHLRAVVCEIQSYEGVVEKIISRSPSLRGSQEYQEFKHALDAKV